MVIKRPHYVPQTYLRAWTDPSGGRLAYRRRDATAAILTSTKSIAVACGIYGKGELGGDAREKAFSDLEVEWPVLRADLITQGNLTGDRRSLLALFAATQLTRTLKHAEQFRIVTDVAKLTEERPIPKSAVRQYLRELDGAEPSDDEVSAAWDFVTGAPAGELSLDDERKIAADVALNQIAPRLERRTWTVRHFRQPALLTNDCPVHVWRQPGKDRPVGGVGIEDADEVRFPLAPDALLVMTRPGESPSNASARAVNAEICRQCHQFVVGLPSAKSALDKLPLPKRAPRVRYRTIYTADGDEILHLYAE